MSTTDHLKGVIENRKESFSAEKKLRTQEIAGYLFLAVFFGIFSYSIFSTSDKRLMKSPPDYIFPGMFGLGSVACLLGAGISFSEIKKLKEESDKTIKGFEYDINRIEGDE